jgi:hypothetical protein
MVEDLYQTDTIRNFNQEMKDRLIRNIEKLEAELSQLTDLLTLNGNLLNSTDGNQKV